MLLYEDETSAGLYKSSTLRVSDSKRCYLVQNLDKLSLKRNISRRSSSGTLLEKTTLTTRVFQGGILEEGEQEMVKTENRPVDVKYCDICQEETGHLSKCLVCKRDICATDGGKKHSAYSLDIYRYRDGSRISSGLICKECAEKSTNMSICRLLDGMLSDSPVPTVGDSPHKDDYLLDAMTDLHFVNAEQVAIARTQAKHGQSVVSVLLEKNQITHEEIAEAKAAHFGTDVICIRDWFINSGVIALISPAQAWCHRIMPIGKEDGVVVVAMTDQSDMDTIDTFVHLLNANITLHVAAEDDMDEALRKYYPEGKEEGERLRREFEAAKAGEDLPV